MPQDAAAHASEMCADTRKEIFCPLLTSSPHLPASQNYLGSSHSLASMCSEAVMTDRYRVEAKSCAHNSQVAVELFIQTYLGLFCGGQQYARIPLLQRAKDVSAFLLIALCG